MRASPERARSSRSAATLPVTKSAAVERTGGAYLIQRARHDLASGEVDHQGRRHGLEHLPQGRDAHAALPESGPPRPSPRLPPRRRRPTAARATGRAARRSRRPGCAAGRSRPSPPRGRAPPRTQPSVFSRCRTGSPRCAMVIGHAIRPEPPHPVGPTRVAGVDRPGHVGDDLVECGLDQAVDRRPR